MISQTYSSDAITSPQEQTSNYSPLALVGLQQSAFCLCVPLESYAIPQLTLPIPTLPSSTLNQYSKAKETLTSNLSLPDQIPSSPKSATSAADSFKTREVSYEKKPKQKGSVLLQSGKRVQLRQDVIMKTVIRTVKRLLAKDISSISNCTASKHKLRIHTQSVRGYLKIIRSTRKFVSEAFPLDHVTEEELGLLAAAFVTCRPLGLPDTRTNDIELKRYTTISEESHNLLLRYNKKRLENFLSSPELSLIFNHYLKRPDFIEECSLQGTERMDADKKGIMGGVYQEAVDEFVSMCLPNLPSTKI